MSDIEKSMRAIGDKVSDTHQYILTEEATKTSIIQPFINALGFDVSNPMEVIPEFTADAVGKKGEKVDYAIKLQGEIQILIECKSIGTKLEQKHLSQLHRYFSVTNAKFAILTNGEEFEFYTDLEKINILDVKPFYTITITDISQSDIVELQKFEKSSFNLDDILANAKRLKYISTTKNFLLQEMSAPSDDLIKIVAANVHDGRATQAVKDTYKGVIKTAFREIVKEHVQARLSSALADSDNNYESDEQIEVNQTEQNEIIVTTEEEIEGTLIVKSIVREVIDVSRIDLRDVRSYCSVLIDNNNRKPLARLHFNSKQKYVSLFDSEEPEKLPISSLDDIFLFSERLKKTAQKYL